MVSAGVLRDESSDKNRNGTTTVVFVADSFRLRLVREVRDGEHAEVASHEDPESWSPIDWAIRAVRNEQPIHPQQRTPREVAAMVAENRMALERGFGQPEYAETARRLDAIERWVLQWWETGGPRR